MSLKKTLSFSKNPLFYVISFFALYALFLFILYTTGAVPVRLIQIAAVFPVLILLIIRNFEHKILVVFFLAFGYHRYFDDSLIITHFLIFLPFFLIFFLYRHPLIKFEKNAITLPFFLLSASFFISFIFSSNYTSSLNMLINYSQAVFFYFYVTNYISSQTDFKNFTIILALSLILPLIVGIYQILFMHCPNLTHVKGTFLSRNSYAPFLAFHIFLLIGFILHSQRKAMKILTFMVFALVFWVFLNTHSRGGLVGIFISLLFYLYLMLPGKYKLTFPLVLIIFISLLVGLTFAMGDVNFFTRFNIETLDGSTIVRVGIWESAYNMFTQKPVTGFGPNTFHEHYVNHFPLLIGGGRVFIETYHKHAHNLFLNTIAEQGILGLIALIFSICILIRHFYKLYVSRVSKSDKIVVPLFISYFVYFFVHSMFDTLMIPYHHISLQHLWAIYFALLVSYERFRKMEFT